MRKQTVAFDIDGVLADFTLGFTSLAAEIGVVKEPWTGYEQPTFNFKFHVAPVWNAVDMKPRFWLDLQPLVTKHERELMNRMAEDVNIVYVTARKASAWEQTHKWLEKYGFPEGPVFFTDDKVPLYLSMGTGLRWAIDDKPDTLRAMYLVGLPSIIRHWPYNSAAPGTRVFSVSEVLRAWEDE